MISTENVPSPFLVETVTAYQMLIIYTFFFFLGMFVENVMAVAKRELRREVDYVNEAKSGKRFKLVKLSFNYFIMYS